MENLKRGKNTPGLDATFDLVAGLTENPERASRYPRGVSFIAADLPDAPRLMSDAIRAKRPFTVVYPDGSDWIVRPPAGAIAVLQGLIAAFSVLDRSARSERSGVDDALYVPRGWTVEHHPPGRPGTLAPA